MAKNKAFLSLMRTKLNIMHDQEVNKIQGSKNIIQCLESMNFKAALNWLST